MVAVIRKKKARIICGGWDSTKRTCWRAACHCRATAPNWAPRERTRLPQPARKRHQDQDHRLKANPGWSQQLQNPGLSRHQNKVPSRHPASDVLPKVRASAKMYSLFRCIPDSIRTRLSKSSYLLAKLGAQNRAMRTGHGPRPFLLWPARSFDNVRR